VSDVPSEPTLGHRPDLDPIAIQALALAEYRDAFRLPQQLPTCSREMSRRLSANASGRRRSGGFHIQRSIIDIM
jgi:hypothetical protein